MPKGPQRAVSKAANARSSQGRQVSFELRSNSVQRCSASDNCKHVIEKMIIDQMNHRFGQKALAWQCPGVTQRLTSELSTTKILAAETFFQNHSFPLNKAHRGIASVPLVSCNILWRMLRKTVLFESSWRGSWQGNIMSS